VSNEFPFYGYRRVTKQMQRQGLTVNKKRVSRVMKTYNLIPKKKRKKAFTTNSRHPFPKYPSLIRNIVPSFPDHIWATDITYIRLPKGFCYLAAIIDMFTRNIRGWSIMNTLAEELVLEALNRALKKGTPMFHHSDRGVQYCATEYVRKLKKKNIQISMSDKGEPTQNPYAESFFRTLKVEEVYLFEYRTIEEAKASITKFITVVYAKKRLHSSLGYQTPKEFEDAWRKQKGQLLLIHNDPPIEENAVSAVS